MFDTHSAPNDRVEFIDLKHADQSFREALLDGLSHEHKSIPCRYLYDHAGAQLFEQICELPEYYPTRTEISILRSAAPQLAALAGPGASIIELGSGAGEKIRILLDALKSPAAYVPIDVSARQLRETADRISEDYPYLNVIALCANYDLEFDLPDLPGRRVAFFPGSTIGNLDRHEAISLLRKWRKRLGPGGMMIIGVDLKKDHQVLEAAYDDSQRVTAAFITNILKRANRELGANFDPDNFAYEARWSSRHGRIEMHLRSTRPQSVKIGAQTITFTEGERIHVENSHKYTLEDFQSLSKEAGYTPAAHFTDPNNLFSVHVLET